MIRFGALLVSVVVSQTSNAFVCYPAADHTEIYISEIDSSYTGSDCPKAAQNRGPVQIVVNSNGGGTPHLGPHLKILEGVVAQREILGLSKPSVVVQEMCMSACIPILATLTQMARHHRIQLRIEPDVRLGFHMVSWDPYTNNGAPAIPETYEYLRLAEEMGLNRDWIDRNFYLFSQVKMTEMHPNDPLLTGSDLLDQINIRASIKTESK